MKRHIRPLQMERLLALPWNLLEEAIQKHGHCSVAMFFSIVLLIFFWRAIFLGEVILPVSVLYTQPPWNAELPPYLRTADRNNLLSDIVYQFFPWAQFTVDSFKNSRVPLWNPYQACGLPFIGNDQSGVFFPLNVLYLVLPFLTAWNSIQMIILFISGFSSYLFARSIRMGNIGAVACGISFMFCGFLIVWLGYPLSKTAAWLPLLFLLSERLATRGDLRSSAFLAVTVGIQFLAGHIETSLHIMSATLLYLLFRIYTIRKEDPQVLGRSLLLAIVALVLGVSLGALQLLPFWEYLTQSDSLVHRMASEPYYLPSKAMITLLVPNFFGNPAWDNAYISAYWARFTNYNESVGGFAGAVIFLFAILAIAYRSRDRIILFFSGLALISVSVIYRFPVVFEIVKSVPMFNVAANQRMLLLVAFSISTLGGFGVDLFLKRRLCVRKTLTISLLFIMVWVLLGSGLILLLAPENPLTIIHHYSSLYGPIFVALKVVQILIPVLSVYMIVLVVAVSSQAKTRRKIIAGLTLTIVVLESFSFAYGYNPMVNSASATYPETGLIGFLRTDNSTFRILPLTAMMPPNTAMVYKLSDLREYDAMSMRRYKEVLNTAGGFRLVQQMTFDYRSPLLNLMNVKYCVVRSLGFPLNVTVDVSQDLKDQIVEITNATYYGQSVVSTQDNLCAIAVMLAAPAGRKDIAHTMVFHLRERPDSTRDIVTISIDSSTIGPDNWLVFFFKPIPNSANRSFYFCFSSPELSTGRAIFLKMSTKDAYKVGQLFSNGKPTDGDLVFRTFFATAESRRFSLEYVGPDGQVWKNNDFLPRAFIVHKVKEASNDSEVLDWMKKSSWPSYAECAITSEIVPFSVLSALDNAPVHDGSSVSIVSYEPNRVRLEAHVQNPGFLILTDNWFPGWTAYVNGQCKRMFRVYHTFRGVFLEAGNHIVEFAYEPLTFSQGLSVTTTALVILLLMLVPSRTRKVKVSRATGQN